MELEEQNVWCWWDKSSILYINSLVASWALIIINDFTFNVLVEPFLKCLCIFHCNLDVHVIVKSRALVSTFRTYLLNAKLTSENLLRNVFLSVLWNGCFYSINEQVKEFFCIFLFSNLCWCTIKLFKCKAELTWIEIASFRKL